MTAHRVFGGGLGPRWLLCCALLSLLAFGGTRLFAQDQPGGTAPPGAAQPTPVPGPMAEWTFMVYLNGDNNLEPYAIRDFLEMAQVGSTRKVNIVVQFDRAPADSSSHVADYGGWTQTLRFLVRRNMTPTVSNAAQDIGEVNMGDGTILKEFVQWARLKYPAKRSMLVVWDHGQGWRVRQAVSLVGRIEGVEGDLTPEALQQAEAQKARVVEEHKGKIASLAPKARSMTTEQRLTIAPGHAINGPIKYCSIDETSGDHLYNREIQDALRAALGRQKLDVVGFDACLMAMVETAYALRQNASYGVFSEEVEPGDGWDYNDVLGKLVTNPTMRGEDFAKEIVKAYATHYGPNSPTTLSAMNLAPSDGLAVTLDSFASALKTALGDTVERTKIRQARDACVPFGASYNLHGVDILKFCNEIINRTGDLTLKAKALGLKNLLGTVITQNYAGQPEVAQYGATGLAIYFPNGKAAFQYDPDHDGYLKLNTTYPVQFVQDHQWESFLQAYFSYNP